MAPGLTPVVEGAFGEAAEALDEGLGPAVLFWRVLAGCGGMDAEWGCIVVGAVGKSERGGKARQARQGRQQMERQQQRDADRRTPWLGLHDAHARQTSHGAAANNTPLVRMGTDPLRKSSEGKGG
jgi:hypothetical protein